MKAINIIAVFALFLLLGTVHSVLMRSSTLATNPTLSSAFSSSYHHQQQERYQYYSNHSPRYSLFPSRSQLRFQSRLFGTDNDTNDSGGGGGSDAIWELMEDWILQDRVPDFTVNCGSTSTSTTSGATIATFWRQLKHTIPELSARTEEELQDRYTTLAKKGPEAATRSFPPRDDGDDDTQRRRRKQDVTMAIGAPFIECGQSPEVLTSWWMDVVEKKAAAAASKRTTTTIMMMHGRLSNGSNIWFPLQSAGTVGASNNNKNDISNRNDAKLDATDVAVAEQPGFSWLVEEGDFIKYVESSAGCIYELGTPKPGSMANLSLLINNNNKESENEETNNSLAAGSRAAVGALDDIAEWLSSSFSQNPSTGMTLAAVVASSLLSASLAFTVGQASLPSQPPPTLATGTIVVTPSRSSAIVPTRQQTSSSQAVTPAILGSGMKYERTVQRDGTSKVVEMSIGEQRASQELRVYREERRLTDLQEKLKTDEATFVQLTELESKLGPAAAEESIVAVPRSPRELSVGEQRARAELKIGADKRRILRMKDSISKGKTKLSELQKEEKQQQRVFFGSSR